MTLIEHAERELRALPGKRDSARIMLERDVVALVGLFSAQRHSGGSAAFVTQALEKLLRWKGLGDEANGDRVATALHHIKRQYIDNRGDMTDAEALRAIDHLASDALGMPLAGMGLEP